MMAPVWMEEHDEHFAGSVGRHTRRRPLRKFVPANVFIAFLFPCIRRECLGPCLPHAEILRCFLDRIEE